MQDDTNPVIVNAIFAPRRGRWDATEGEVIDRILVMRPAMRRRRCCGQDLDLVTAASRGSFTWELRRCGRCERTFSIGPKLPPTWGSVLAQRCITLYSEYQAAVAAVYQRP